MKRFQVFSFGLFYLTEQTFGLDRDIIQTLIYLKLSVAGHLTVFVTRTRGPFWKDRPAPILLGAVLGTQVIATLMSCDPEIDGDIPALIGTSAALALSGIPFSGPIGGVRVALINGQWVAFPTHQQLEEATFDMVVAGRVVGDEAIHLLGRQHSLFELHGDLGKR